jgi:hypothetical protein
VQTAEWKALYETHRDLLYTHAVLKPYDHQLLGVHNVVLESAPGLLPDGTPDPYGPGRVCPGCFALFDEMGVGKTKQTIDAASMLRFLGLIKRVIVISPAAVRSVWFDPEFGQITQHGWRNLYHKVTEWHSKSRTWSLGKGDELEWIITNYDFIRSEERLEDLMEYADGQTMLVLDESSAIKNATAIQTKAVLKLRKKCARVLELNGTPIANAPLDLFSQANIMDPRILDCKSQFIFKIRYAIMGGWQGKQILQWKNMDDLKRRIAPYVLRRVKEECLDLPEKLPSVIITAPMTPTTWKHYKAMRDDMVTWLNQATVSVAQQTIVKALRLTQMTSGFLGGIEQAIKPQDVSQDARPDWLPVFGEPDPEIVPSEEVVGTVQEIGREKLDTFLAWYKLKLENEPKAKVLVWCRFRPELARLIEEIKKVHPQVITGQVVGGQKPNERQYALRLLDPRTSPNDAPVLVAGTPSTGSMGLDFTAAHIVVYMSNDYNLKTRLQSEDRNHRPGQRHDVSYFDIVAVGPAGQRTIDHGVLKNLLSKRDMATMTAADWVSALSD